MKTMDLFKQKLSVLLLSLLLLGLNSCSDDDNKTVEIKAEASEFTPLIGGPNTVITLKGKNFGTDTENIKVTINGKETILKSVTNEEITAEVPKGASTGLVRVILGERPNAQVLIYDVEFTYISNQIVSTYLGSISGETDGSFEAATLCKPRFLVWGKDGGLYIVEDGATSATDFPSIRVAKDNNVSTILNATTTTLAQRIRAIDFSLDMNTMYIANDNNASGSMGFGTMTKSGNTYANLSELWDQSGITGMKVHPETGAVFIAYHTGAWIYQYESGSFIPKIQLPSSATGEYADKGNVNGIVFDKEGTTVYFVSRAKHVIYKASYDLSSGEFGNAEIFAGSYGVAGYENGVGTAAKFNTPCQADIDEDGNLYIADRANNCIRMVTPEGEVSTFAGTNSAGMLNGVASQAEFSNPEGCQFGPDGALYIADYSNHLIRKIEEKSGE